MLFPRLVIFASFLFCMDTIAADLVRITGTVDLGELRQIRRKRSSDYDRKSLEKAGPPAPRIGAVYLRSDPMPQLLENPQSAELSQESLQFSPHVVVIQVGASVSFPNYDDSYHNVFSYSSAKSFDLGRYLNKNEPPQRLFDKPGEIEVFCEVHSHMKSTILVVETPYYTTTDPEGNFALEDVAPGNYELVVWRNPGDTEAYPIVVNEGETPQVFDLDDE